MPKLREKYKNKREKVGKTSGRSRPTVTVNMIILCWTESSKLTDDFITVLVTPSKGLMLLNNIQLLPHLNWSPQTSLYNRLKKIHHNFM